MYQNPVLDHLPKHLRGFIIERPWTNYTGQDHAIWRYVMRRNIDFLKDKAHPAYLEGLSKTGISLEYIPDMQTMNDILKNIGWGAVTVDGFIPPAAFMEFQAYRVLVIAGDIRPIDQVEYTPAPDIIHEAAGHAPIIADADYAAYLQHFGDIGAKAFSSAADYELYEAIRYLSILKADPYAPSEKIALAELALEAKERSLGIPSEMAYIRNLHWWTVEYGLVGDLKKPFIYGAGLLSSIGESAGVVSERVKKLPYSIDAVYYNFDITKPQPQLFVTPDFAWLSKVLDSFAERMALRKGGVEGLLKAVESGQVATCVYSSGLQVSGRFSDFILHQNQPAYLQTTGPTTLCYASALIPGHGTDTHAHGFGSPIGSIKGTLKPPRYLETADLEAVGIRLNEACNFEFESGITVSGVLTDVLRKEGKLVLMRFRECTVSYQGRILFEPAWGFYDMAVGEALVSVYSGPANPDAYGLSYPEPAEKTHRLVHNDAMMLLFNQYDQLRQYRSKSIDRVTVLPFAENLLKQYSSEWLLLLEAVELAIQLEDAQLTARLVDGLTQLSKQKPGLESLIKNGLRLLGK